MTSKRVFDAVDRWRGVSAISAEGGEVQIPWCTSARQEFGFDQVPCLETGKCHDGQSQRRPDRGSIVVIGAFGYGIVSTRRRSTFAHSGGSGQQVLMQQLVLSRAYRVSQRVAQDWVDSIWFTGRGRLRGAGGGHVDAFQSQGPFWCRSVASILT